MKISTKAYVLALSCSMLASWAHAAVITGPVKAMNLTTDGTGIILLVNGTSYYNPLPTPVQIPPAQSKPTSSVSFTVTPGDTIVKDGTTYLIVQFAGTTPIAGNVKAIKLTTDGTGVILTVNGVGYYNLLPTPVPLPPATPPASSSVKFNDNGNTIVKDGKTYPIAETGGVVANSN